MSEVLQQAVCRLLRPLIRAMIKGGITFPVLVTLVRKTYVDVAMADYRLNDKPPTLSRIALLTGMQRREIKRLAEETSPDKAPPQKISLSAKVIAVWCSKPDYLDKRGRPRPLPRTAAEGEPSFEQLVASVSVDMRARTLLEEWLDSGVVELRSGLIRLIQAALVPSRGYEEKAYYFGRNLRDHIAAGAHNLAESSPTFFDRAVYYDRISPESVEELRKLCAERGEQLLLGIIRHTRKLAERDRAEGEPNGRMTFGAYYYAEDDSET